MKKFVTMLSCFGLVVGANAADLSVRVNNGTDDAEEKEDASAVYVKSTDLEMVKDEGTSAGNQKIGLRFCNVMLNKGAKITSAKVQFTCDEVTAEETSLTIKGEAVDNAETFTEAGGNISLRTATEASVNWTPPAWDVEQRADAAELTPDISPIIQEIVNRPGWVSGNAIALIITGTGMRTAESFEGGNDQAALLNVSCEGDLGPAGATPEPAPAPAPDAAAPVEAPAAAPVEEPAAAPAAPVESEEVDLVPTEKPAE